MAWQPRDTVVELRNRYGRDDPAVLDHLRAQIATKGRLTAEAVHLVAGRAGLPEAAIRGAASFYEDLGFVARGVRHVRLCAGTACFVAPGKGRLGEVERVLGETPAAGADEGDGEGAEHGGGSLQVVHCVGACYAAPAALDGERLRAGPDLVGQLAGHTPATAAPIPFRAAVDDPVALAGLAGGEPAWSVWPAVAARADAGLVLGEVGRAGLRGRGGAGFPTAEKWAAALAQPSEDPRYVVANGDEGDPGSFADRLLMESDPARVLEGMALAGLAVGAKRGVVYVRSEYPAARERLRVAVADARAAGHLGRDLHGGGIDFDVEVVGGAGSYVSGEETALIRSLEGLRGAVRTRPPYPSTLGLFGRPTVVNNVETLAAVPWIVRRGGEAFARLGVASETGTKLVSLNEAFVRPGVVEVELGVPLRRIVDEVGGGLRDGRRLRALQVGGPLGGFLGPGDLDLPLLDSALVAAGAGLGHGGLIAIDERVSPAELLAHIWRFVASESCGACAPCRVGSRRGLELAQRAAGGATASLLAEQEALLDVLGPASLCAFGRSVPQAMRSLVRVYRDQLLGEAGPAMRLPT